MNEFIEGSLILICFFISIGIGLLSGYIIHNLTQRGKR